MKRLLPNSLTLPSHGQDVRTRALVPAGVKVREWRDWVVDNDPVYGSFRRPGRTEKIAASVTLLLILAVAVFVLLFDWNWLRGPVGRWASAKYDREIALQGDLDVNLFSWTPSVIVNDLKFGGPDWAREADTANVERIEARFRLRKLFAGQVDMPLLAITRPNVVLISTEDGRQSWELEPDKPDTGEGIKLPLINQLIIQDGRISLDARDRDITLEAAISAREAASEADGASGFTLTGEGSVNGSPLTLKIEGGAFVNIRRNRPYHFEATLAGARSRLVADGAITRPFDLGQFTSTLTLQGQDLNDLYLLTGVTLPNTPPYRLSGALTRNDAVWTFNDFTGRVGASDLSGDMTVDAGERLRVEAALSSRLLDIDDLMAILGADTRTNVAGTNTTVVASGSGPGMLLPDGTLQVDRLRGSMRRATCPTAP